jgi:radical SAM protein with 4Fe4S-binding SPASM domain
MKKYKRIYVEITNVCNLNCSFCPETKRPAAFMTLDDFRSILKQIMPFTDYIYFHVKGEPLLHPQLGQFLDLCNEYGLEANITTNGTRISEASENLLTKPALRQINFSLHSFDSNEAGTGKDRYLSRIFSAVEQIQKTSKTIVSLRLWNLGQRDTRYETSNHDILNKIEAAFNLPYNIKEGINPAKGIKIAERVYLSQDSEFEWPTLDQNTSLQAEASVKGFCHALKSQIAILVDGTVVPCCLDGNGIMQLGNIHTRSFSDIIAGERAEKIRQGFARKVVVEALCRRCTYRKRFDRP